MIEAADHLREVEDWRRRRYEALRRDTGWLTLAGLDWLRDGDNLIGSGSSADVRLPGGPAVAGLITLDAGGATATGEFLHAGTPANGLRLVSDTDGDPTMLELGDLRFCLIERGGRLAVRTWDLDSDLRRGFNGVDHWPVDPAWRLDARFEPIHGRTVSVPDVLGFVDDEESPGDLAFEAGGAVHRIQALPGGPGGELWLVFADETNGAETYGGGRFLYTDAPETDGDVIVDFNRAYNPPCVFSRFATCPLPWPANRLALRIEAGERTYDLPGR